MALYKDSDHVKLNDDPAFDLLHRPGDPAPYAGIYRCINCGHEIGIATNHKLPPQDHSQHKSNSGKIMWQLLVFAQQKINIDT